MTGGVDRFADVPDEGYSHKKREAFASPFLSRYLIVGLEPKVFYFRSANSNPVN
jgi:hypothetical protein